MVIECRVLLRCGQNASLGSSLTQRLAVHEFALENDFFLFCFWSKKCPEAVALTLAESALEFDSAVGGVLDAHPMELVEPEFPLKRLVLCQFEKLFEVKIFRFKVHFLGHVPELRCVEGSVAMPHGLNDFSLVENTIRIVYNVSAILEFILDEASLGIFHQTICKSHTNFLH